MNYFFNPEARAEHLEHVAYYESRQPGLGARYLAAFNAAMVNVCTAPHRYKVEFPPNIRRYRVLGFPYNILPDYPQPSATFDYTENQIKVLKSLEIAP